MDSPMADLPVVEAQAPPATASTRAKRAKKKANPSGSPAPATSPNPAKKTAQAKRVTQVARVAPVKPVAADHQPGGQPWLQAPGRQRAEWGGTLIGAALLGWLAAAGAAIVLTDFIVAAGTAVALGQAGTGAAGAPMGFAGAVSLFAIHFMAYTAGGYVAGRISRFSGAIQGLLVWVFALLVAIAVAGLAATAGEQYNVLARFNVFPRIPIGEGDLTPATAITVVLLVILSLVGAVVGGVLGKEFYRRAARRGAHY
jgi:hypothetical protein